MTFKKYNLLDRGSAILDEDIVASDDTFQITGAENLPATNSTLTITQKDSDGNPIKSEKIHYTTLSGTTFTWVSRGYAGSTAKSFDEGSILELNIIAEHITDIQNEVARLNTDKASLSQVYLESEVNALLWLKANLDGGNTMSWDQLIAWKLHLYWNPNANEFVEFGSSFMFHDWGHKILWFWFSPWSWKALMDGYKWELRWDPNLGLSLWVDDVASVDGDAIWVSKILYITKDQRVWVWKNPWVDFDVLWVGRFSDNLIWNNGIYAQGIGSAILGSNEGALKSQNTSSGAIWSRRVTNTNEMIYEYFNGATWLEKWRMTTNWKFLFWDVAGTRDGLGLPKHDESVISNIDTFKETGWRVVTPTAPWNPTADYNWVFCKMINPSFGFQELESRTTREKFKRYLDAGTWSPWKIENDNWQWESFTSSILEDWTWNAVVVYFKYQRIGQTVRIVGQINIPSPDNTQNFVNISTPLNCINTTPVNVALYRNWDWHPASWYCTGTLLTIKNFENWSWGYPVIRFSWEYETNAS